jgi:hypothetical protein
MPPSFLNFNLIGSPAVKQRGTFADFAKNKAFRITAMLFFYNTRWLF